MKQMIAALLLATACASAPPADDSMTKASAVSPAPEETVQVMVLGVYHFSNPGLDLVNAKADDVLSPKRQAELQALAGRLAEFRPTAIAVEVTRPDGSLIDPRFASYTPEDLAETRNETVQIGYRLAGMAGIDRVYAIDEQEGEIPFFPWDRIQAFAERTGQTGLVESMISQVQERAEAQEAAQETETISQLLARHNDPEKIAADHSDFYYRLLAFSDAEDQAGAALNYGWYARNALIFSNLTEVAGPGDRVVVIYGAGHNFWLRHFVEEMPGYELVEALPYLEDHSTANGS